MAETSEEQQSERARLRAQARTADDPDTRRQAIRRLAALDRERNRETYGKLEHE